MTHKYPALHNAMWPGLVGKGPDSEPPIELETMLDMTAATEVDGVRFDGVDLFLSDPHTPIDASQDDLKRLATVVQGISQSVVVQLSTYSANYDNSQKDVLEVVTSLLKCCGLEIVATVPAKGQMMSLVLARGIGWSDSIRSLACRFTSWLACSTDALGRLSGS